MDGTPFGRYRLMDLLGRGGMGEVWRAHDTETDRVVAIKLLPAYLSGDAEFQHRFRREAHAAARLNSPHVIPIHHYGEIDGQLYVDMRLIEGHDLQAALADGPLDPARAVGIVEQIAKALHAAHQAGLLHRDIKPSNILLDADDFAYLIDFGIARAINETRMTKSGNTIGTFQYIAPERFDSRAQEDARADIYSLACVLYECLTGQPPYPGDSTTQLMYAHVNIPPPRASISRPQVPPQVDDVIATGMAKDPNQRYATTIELAGAARDAITVPGVATPAAPVTRYRQPQPGPGDPAATRQPAGRPAAPPTLLPTPTPTPTPTPAPRRRTGVMVALAATAAVVVFAVIGIAGYLLFKPRHPSQTSTPQAAPRSNPIPSAPQVAPGAPNSLDGLLLGVDQINTAMGTTGMSAVGTMTKMLDNSYAVSDPACIPLSSAAEATVYAGSGYSTVRAQVVANGQQNAVNQVVVLFPSARDAGSFYTASGQGWAACSNRQFTISANGNSQVHTVGPVSNTNGMLSATVTPANSLGVCERALTVANDIAVDVTSCGGPSGAAVSVAHQIAAKIPAAH